MALPGQTHQHQSHSRPSLILLREAPEVREGRIESRCEVAQLRGWIKVRRRQQAGEVLGRLYANPITGRLIHGAVF